jgi:hypothetical protein
MTATIDRTMNRTETVVEVEGKGELTGFLADLALTTLVDPAKPGLGLIRLHTENGRLHGWSVDGFRLAHAVVAAPGHFDGPLYILGSDVRQLVSMFGKAPRVTARVGSDTFTVSDGDNSVTLRLVDTNAVSYPAIENIAKDDLPDNCGPVTFNPAYLESFTKVARRRKESVMIVSSLTRPAHVAIGERYRAWLMPDRRHNAARLGCWLPSEF